MTDIEWENLTLLAKGDDGTPPRPEQMQARIQRWSWEFERLEGGTPLLADFPAPVQAFFRWMAEWPGRGRPCSDQKRQAAAFKAWEHCALKAAHTSYMDLIRVTQSEFPIGEMERIVIKGLTDHLGGTSGTPSTEALLILAAQRAEIPLVEVKDTEWMRDLIYPRKPTN